MASEFVPPPSQLPQDELNVTIPQSSSSLEETSVNGLQDSATSMMQPIELATEGKLTATGDQTHLPSIEAEAEVPDPNPTASTTIEHVETGIAPIADFIPKDAPTTSHPTPPPDEPLVGADADVDVDMASAEGATSPPAIPDAELQSPPVTAHAESSLVRPREDDEEEEPVAKRSKLEDDQAEVVVAETEVVEAPIMQAVADVATPPVSVPVVDATAEPVAEEIVEVEMPLADEALVESSVDPDVDAVVETTAEPIAEEMVDQIVEPAIEPAVQDVVAQVEEPAVVAPAEGAVVESITEPATDAVVETITEHPDGDVEVKATRLELDTSDATSQPVESSNITTTLTETPVTQTPIDEKSVQTPTTPAAPVQADTVEAPLQPPVYSTAPMTPAQKKSLLEKTKNLKKTRNSMAFLKPVDAAALNIPTYYDIITNPMDLGTLETKLKEDRYASVQDYVNDFDLIINNVRRFNGDQHPVTQAGRNMEAYFIKMMQSVPGPNEEPPVKTEKKRSPSISREKPRRESRAAAQSVAPAPAATTPASATAPTDVYALHADGTPQIRRQSSISNRPARAIKPPQNREIPYAKPKRKEHQLELRFCEYILDELRSQKYGASNSVFLWPVDPVALNIPHYRQIVKQPMDLSTMSQKLKSGQYGTASEFKKDFDLMIKNCLVFNPAGNPVRDLGIQFQRDFEALWANKEKWERKNEPASNRASSASGDEESGADDEDEDDEPDDDKNAQIKALQKQLTDLQNSMSKMIDSDKPSKSKKSKQSKSSGKKQGSSKSSASTKKAAAPPKPAPKPKKARVVTYDEKQEISEAVNRMNEAQTTKITEIIMTNDPRYADMEEMELEIDELTVEVQNMLLKYVRSIFGNPNQKKGREPSPDDAAAMDDDDYEERGGARGGKRKKHKPMGKKEQQDTITSIKNKLAEFSQVGTSGSESPTNSSFVNANAQAESSGDEESEESEEE